MKIKKIIIASLTALLIGCTGNEESGHIQNFNFEASRKPASQFTKDFNKSILHDLNFDDTTDFMYADKGFIAPLLDSGYIEGVADIPSTQFMMNKEAPAEVNPSLWRHAQLVNRGGLYEVLENKVYQVRGADLANLTIIETNTGIVLYDICASPATMKKALELYSQHRGERPLKAVIISHSHTDHFGGYPAILEMGLITQDDIKTKKVPIYVPQHFLKEAVSENVLYGNIMSRRAVYQYGFLLQKDSQGAVTSALGPLTPGGANGLPADVVEITSENSKVHIDGINFEFMLVPETEAPAEMVFLIPEWGALSMAEDVNRLQHNVYSMRGAKIRDAGRWGEYIHKAIVRWGDKVKVHFGPHTWPVWGNEEVITYLKSQRDIYKAINDQTNRLANYGYRPRDIVKNMNIPDPIMKAWTNRDYYGQFENNVIATYVRNIGWFNANPTELARHNDSESGKRYVEAFGGEDKIIEQAIKFFEQGDYRFTVELLNKIVAFNPNNEKANYLMADAFEQLGYQEESALARNWYLTASLELRSEDQLPQGVTTAGIDVLKAIPGDLMMNFFATLVVPERSMENGRIAFQLELGGKLYGIEVENGVMNSANSYKPVNSAGVIKTDNLTIFSILGGNISMEEALSSGALSTTGEGNVFGTFLSLLDENIPNNFNLVKTRK